MEYNSNKNFFRRFLSFLLVLSILSSVFYLPSPATPRAHAFWGIADTTWDVPAWVDRAVDGVSMALAQQLIDRMVQSSVKWAQSGFEGNPGYVTDPKQFFSDVADGVAGEYIMGTDLGFLCSPFQANIRLSLTANYSEPEPFQCTLTEVVGNIENFYTDFSAGGWDGWFAMTQNETNNPYGAYLAAKVELDSRIAEKVGLERELLNWSDGFLSWSECIETNPPLVNPSSDPTVLPSTNTRHVPGKAVGECIARGPIQTPGTTLKAQLDNVLPSGLQRLISVQHIDQLVGAFASGLLTRYVFGPRGLFANTSSNTSTTPSSPGGANTDRLSRIDLDGDLIPDGQDLGYDGALNNKTDVCFHGGIAPNCVRSSTVTRSPYFTPVCQALDRTIITLTDYTNFINDKAGQIRGGLAFKDQIVRNILRGPVSTVFDIAFGGSGGTDFVNEADAQLWSSRTSYVDGALSDLMGNIETYNAPFLDNLEIDTNRFQNFIGKVFESLAKDNDLDLSNWFGSGGGGLKALMRKSAYTLRYYQEVKRQIGRCESPDIGVIPNIPPVPTDPDEEGGPECPGPALDMPPGTAPDDSWLDVLGGIEVSPADTLAFRDAVVEALHAEDSNFGYNGKRGNPNDLSTDALAYLAEGPDKPDSVFIIDFIVGSDGPNPTLGWQDVTEETYLCGATGYYVAP